MLQVRPASLFGGESFLELQQGAGVVLQRLGFLKHGLNLRSESTRVNRIAPIADSPPDLVILDVFMPSMSGLELADALKKDAQTSGIPLLAMSAYHEYEKGAPRRDLATDDFLKKPISKDELMKKVRALLG